MGQDDADEGGLDDGCLQHVWIPEDFQIVERNGVTGMSIVNRCKWCPAVFYEPSNVDRFPNTKGLDPRLY